MKQEPAITDPHRTGMPVRATAIALLLTPAISWADLYAGQSLPDALIDLNLQGANLVFSSEVVKADMRVVESPTRKRPRAMAREIIAPHGLTLIRAPGGRWLVTHSRETPLQGTDHNPTTNMSGVPESHWSPVEEIVVISARYRIYGDAQVAEFDHEEVDQLPHLADDLMRAVNRLPGAAADDFSAQINMRGGTREETAIYLDGLKLIDPFHLKDINGAFSIVDSNLIERVDVLPGGFTARYGDQASGIIAVDTLSPPDQPVYSAGVNFVNSFVNTRGSFDDGRGGWLVSLRRGYLDWLFRLVDTGESEFTPRYVDLLAKVEHDISERHTLSWHTLAARDDFGYIDDTEDAEIVSNADTLFLWARLRSYWTTELTSEMVLWRNAIERTRIVGVDDLFDITADLTELRDIATIGIRSDWQWQPSGSWSVGFGLEATNIRVDYDYSLSAITNSTAYPARPPVDRHALVAVDGRTLQFHALARRNFGRLSVELGWRRDAESYTGLDEAISSPRVNMRFDVSADTRLLLGWGDYYQFQPPEGLEVEDGVDEFARAMSAEHRVIGFEHQFGPSLSLRIDTYQKRYRHLRPRYINLFDSYEPIPEAKPDRYRVNADSADARGLEIGLKRRAADRFSWWVTYTHARVTERVDGVDVRREWDQPHALSAVLNWGGPRWNVNVASTWRTGWPRTEAEAGIVDTPDGPLPAILHGPRNAGRFDDYLRVDARVSRKVQLARGSFTYFFEVYNLFDTRNVCCFDEQWLAPGPSVRGDYSTWIPRMPSFGFLWKFR